MKRNNPIDFTIPQRQSNVAILMIIWKTYTIVFRQIIPLVVLFFIGGKNPNTSSYLMYGIIGVAVLSMIYSILAFFKFRFYIDEDELIINKGIFNKKKISIDIDRVQTINFEQNIIHKLFDVARLKADTAGSVTEEFSLDAIDKKTGYALRDIVMQYKSDQAQNDSEENVLLQKLIGSNQEHQTKKLILEISPKELFIAGMVENHLKSSSVIIGFFFYIYFNMYEFGLDPQDYTGEVPVETLGSIMILFLLLLLFVASFIISMIRMVLTYYDLKLVRSGQGFRYTAGLFTKRVISALDQKIQKVTWSDNLLKKLIGNFDLKFEQAGAEALNQKKSITVPACKIHHIKTVLTDVFPNLNFESIALKKISKLWLYRQVLYRSIPVVVFLVGGIIFSPKLFIVFSLAIIFLFHAFLKFNKAAYGYDDNYFYLKGGVYGDKNTIFPIYKVQSVERSQSPYMRRKGLTTLTFYHASGSSTVPYIPNQKALEIMNFMLYRIESSKDRWM